MGITLRLDGDVDGLKKELARLSKLNMGAVLKNVEEGLRTSTMERFRTEESPDGTKWITSKRAASVSGKTLTKTSLLKQSIKSAREMTGVAVGTNDIRAATLQFGAEDRVIRAKRNKNLVFKVNGRWVSANKVVITIPPRPFLGISEFQNNPCSY